LVRDSEATIALRQMCRARKDLVGHRVAATNQLRAHLHNVLPGVVGLFADLDSAISLAFLARFDCQDRVDWLSAKRLAAWLASVGYSGRVDPAELYARLVAAPRGATGQYGAAQTHITKALLAVLTTLSEQIKALTVQISRQLALHADQQIFTSLPRSGRSAPPGCWPRSAIAAAAFPVPTPWPAWPVLPPPLDNPAKAAPSISAGRVTKTSATLFVTSPATAATPTPGPPTFTSGPATAATTTLTRSGFSPAHGCM
jgi:hypothetical protein